MDLVMKFNKLVNRCHMGQLYNWFYSTNVNFVPYNNYFENISDLLHVLKTPFKQKCVKLKIYLDYGVEFYNSDGEEVYKLGCLSLKHILQNKGAYNKIFRDEIYSMHDQLKTNALSIMCA